MLSTAVWFAGRTGRPGSRGRLARAANRLSESAPTFSTEPTQGQVPPVVVAAAVSMTGSRDVVECQHRLNGSTKWQSRKAVTVLRAAPLVSPGHGLGQRPIARKTERTQRSLMQLSESYSPPPLPSVAYASLTRNRAMLRCNLQPPSCPAASRRAGLRRISPSCRGCCGRRNRISKLIAQQRFRALI